MAQCCACGISGPQTMWVRGRRCAGVAVFAAAGRDQQQRLVRGHAERGSHLCAGTLRRFARDVAAVAQLGRGERREGVFAPQVEDLGAADDEHFIVVGLDRLVVAVLGPDAARRLDAVEDVAQQQHQARPALCARQRFDRAREFVFDAERLLVHQHQVGPEVGDRALDQVGAQPHRLVQVERQRARAVVATRVARQAGQLDVVDARRDAKGVQHRAAGQHQHRDLGRGLHQVARHLEHAADVAQAEGVVRIDEDALHGGVLSCGVSSLATLSTEQDSAVEIRSMTFSLRLRERCEFVRSLR
jgi:hypothetical protein